MTRPLAAWAVLAILCGFSTPPPDLQLQRVIHAMRFPGVEVGVTWEQCGEMNAYYHPRTKSVTLCRELLALEPGVIRFILAHEMAHAAIIQLDLPYTGLHETAADELAAVFLSLYGMVDDVELAGRWWFARGFQEVENGEPVEYWFAEHPGNKRRGAALYCLAEGYRGNVGRITTIENERIASFRCDQSEWQRKRTAWARLLGFQQ